MSEKLPITVLVQTKNEELGIAKCLSALGDFSEIIVVDSNSTDRTSTIAESMGVSVVNFTWNGEYPKKKQWQLDNVPTKNSWILFLDADEFPTDALILELNNRREELAALTFSAYDVPLEYVFAGQPLRYGHRVVKRCLLDRQRCKFPTIDDLGAPGMGELEGHYQPVANGSTTLLDSRLLHDDQDPVATWFERHNRYSGWEAYLRTNPTTNIEAAKLRSRQGQIFDRAPFKPLVFFLFAYLARRGFLDGRAGFDYAFALSSYYWQIGLKVRELERIKRQKSTPADSTVGDSRQGMKRNV